MKKAALYILFLVTSHFFAQEWQTNFSKAKSLAKLEKKKLIMVFQGSDWCAPCIKLGKKIWGDASFQSYAGKHYVMLQLDFPRRKKNKLSRVQQEHNNQLASQYNKGGAFPLVVVLDSDGKLIGKTGYKNLSAQDYIKHIESL